MYFESLDLNYSDLVNFIYICGEDLTPSLTNKKCENLMTVYWLTLISFGFLILTILTLYPFFKINKKKK